MQWENNKKTYVYTLTLVVITGLALMAYFNKKQIIEIPGEPLGISTAKTLPEDYKNAAWLWKSPGNMTEEEVEEITDFSRDKNIKVIYLFIEEYLSIVESERKVDKELEIAQFNEKVKKFITIAGSKGIEVEALAGNVDWAGESHEYIPHALMDYVIGFNANPENNAKFAGIHFDIEFYNQKNFKNNKYVLTEEFLVLVRALVNKNKANGDQLRLGFAVPYWLDNEKGVIPKINFGSKEQLVIDHMLDLLEPTNSYMVLMAYRNKYDGVNGSIEISRGDIARSDSRGGKVKIYVGLETVYNELKSITYFGKTSGEFNQAAQNIAQAFADTKSFSGIVVHTLDGYQKLGE